MRLLRSKTDDFGPGYLNRCELIEHAPHGLGDNPITRVRHCYEEFFKDRSNIGGYPILFTTDRGDVFCASCAKYQFIMEDEDVTADVYSEGDVLRCDGCGVEIESAYGPVE